MGWIKDMASKIFHAGGDGTNESGSQSRFRADRAVGTAIDLFNIRKVAIAIGIILGAGGIIYLFGSLLIGNIKDKLEYEFCNHAEHRPYPGSFMFHESKIQYSCTGCGRVFYHETEMKREMLIEPTCTRTGLERQTLTFDGYEDITKTRDVIIAALPHENTLVAPAEDATCNKEGVTAEYECSVCYTHTGGEKVAKLPHKPKLMIAATEPTCQERGNTASYACSVCGEYTVPRKILDKVACRFETVTHEPTEDSEGWDEHTCVWCGRKYKDNFKNPINPKVSISAVGDHCIVTGYKVNQRVLVIPAYFNDLPVTHIDTIAFKDNTLIEELYLPDTLVEIGERAFEGCTNLKKVHFNEGLTVIGSLSFWNCTALREISIPASVSAMYSTAFQGCTGLLRVEFAENSALTSFRFSWFSAARGLRSLKLPGGKTNITYDYNLFPYLEELYTTEERKNSMDEYYLSKYDVKTDYSEPSSVVIED